MMEISGLMFYMLATLIVIGSAAVLLLPNPIYAALSLAITMIGIGFIYFQLGAYFIAGVQLIVYAGAVMVLFVMVLMLFDLKEDDKAIAGGSVSVFLKATCGVVLAGLLSWAVAASIIPTYDKISNQTAVEQMAAIKHLAMKLFTQYVFAFEILGILLLVIAVGVVAISRTSGGTHARD